MTFTSLTFLYFIVIVFFAYWSLHTNYKVQNLLLLVVSCIFYGWWDYRFIGLMFLSSMIDYYAGKRIYTSASRRTQRLLLIVSMTSNLVILGFFKYFNFFLDSLQTVAHSCGYSLSVGELNVILPVGISFYTFQSMSYCIDIYRGNLKPADGIVPFMANVAFFPHLVAGPIQRAVDLLGQFSRPRVFDYDNAVFGLRLMLLGFFRKILVADNLGFLVDQIYTDPGRYTNGELLMGTLCFAFQIYCDFAAYSEIARGTAKLFGFELMRNFDSPYLATNIRDFWRRWHISLSTWFRDYVYFPLGGNRVGFMLRSRNILVVFLLSGLWHGARWTFVLWGAFHALYFILYDAFSLFRTQLRQRWQSPFWQAALAEGTWAGAFLGMMATFAGVLVAWVFFRAANLAEAFAITGRILSRRTLGEFVRCAPNYSMALWLMGGCLLAEFIHRQMEGRLAAPLRVQWRWALYVGAVFGLLILGGRDEAEFIYFQF